MLAVLAALAVVAVVLVFTTSGSTPGGAHGGSADTGAGSGGGSSVQGTPLTLVSTTPSSAATAVPSNTTITLNFSAPVSLGSAKPTLSPMIGGRWTQPAPTTLAYELAGPLIPSTYETVTVPGGKAGIRGIDGGELSTNQSFAFSVANGDPLRLQQLLAQLGYLPLTFTDTGTPADPQDIAMDQPGTFAWRWTTLPAELTNQWTQGSIDAITKAAIMTFENSHNLGVDGQAGPAVWTALLNDAAAHRVATNPYVYVVVNKVRPESLTLWENGAVDLSNVLVNTGASGADTTDGTFAVFEHVRYSEMKGTNPDGSKYDDPNVPYASYFNGGDALHGFIRPAYGYPQSNGCVEMSYANAAVVWPLTPIGTLVTVEGPATPGPPPTTTTTTTTAPPATTTTVAPPPPPTTTVAP